MAADIFGIIAPHPPILVPEVGGADAETARASLDALSIAHQALLRFNPETVVVMSPHAPAAADTMLVDTSESLSGDLGQFGDEKPYRWRGDPVLAAALLDELAGAGIVGAARATQNRFRAGWLDHATIVPLSFLDPGARFAIVVVSLSWLSLSTHRAVGHAAQNAARRLGRRVAFVASGDCSHRLKPDAPAGYSPRGAEFDAWVCASVSAGELEVLASADPGLAEAAGECGLRSFVALGGFAGQDPVPARLLAYEAPWGVGYLTALVGRQALDSAEEASWPGPHSGVKGGIPGTVESEIVVLARSAIEAFIRGGVVLEPEPLLGAEYPERAGAFVSLHRGAELRGCIGTIAPMARTLAEEVVSNAIEAAAHDPRFPVLASGELDDLDVKVDVLHEPEPCGIGELDPARYGVIVSSGWRRGLLLPDLDGVDTVTEQVAIALRKGGIDGSTPYDIERFKVDRYT